MGSRSKDSTLFALQERKGLDGGWSDVLVRQKQEQLPLPVKGRQRVRMIRNRKGR